MTINVHIRITTLTVLTKKIKKKKNNEYYDQIKKKKNRTTFKKIKRKLGTNNCLNQLFISKI